MILHATEKYASWSCDEVHSTWLVKELKGVHTTRGEFLVSRWHPNDVPSDSGVDACRCGSLPCCTRRIPSTRKCIARIPRSQARPIRCAWPTLKLSDIVIRTIRRSPERKSVCQICQEKRETNMKK